MKEKIMGIYNQFSTAFASVSSAMKQGEVTPYTSDTFGTAFRQARSTVNEGSNIDIDTVDLPSDDTGFLASLGKVESRNNYYAKPNSSGYEGKYQFRYRRGDDGYKYAKILGVTPDQIRKSPKLQEAMMQRVLIDYDKQLKGSKIPVNNWTRWLRHNQGLGGARAILRGKLTPTIRRNIRNQGVSGNTDSDLIANYTKKFKHRFSSKSMPKEEHSSTEEHNSRG